MHGRFILISISQALICPSLEFEALTTELSRSLKFLEIAYIAVVAHDAVELLAPLYHYLQHSYRRLQTWHPL